MPNEDNRQGFKQVLYQPPHKDLNPSAEDVKETKVRNKQGARGVRFFYLSCSS